jgi:hypothetical protein
MPFQPDAVSTMIIIPGKTPSSETATSGELYRGWLKALLPVLNHGIFRAVKDLCQHSIFR